MTLKHALPTVLLTGIAIMLTGARLEYFEESLPTTLNPLYANSMVDHRTQELIFDRLWYRDPITNNLTSRILESRWEAVPPDGLAIKFTVREGINWHSGAPLTAKDVCFTVDAMLDPGTPSELAAKYREYLAGCETQGQRGVTIRFNRVYHNPRDRLGFSVLPHAEFSSTAITPDLDFSSRPVGSGPYVGVLARRGVALDAFANGHHTPSINQLAVIQGGDPISQIRSITNNGAQGIVTVPPAYRPELGATDEVALKTYDLRSWWFIAVNDDRRALSDRRVRQALNYLIDRTDLREKTIGFDASDEDTPCEFISGPFVQSSPYYNRAIPTTDTADAARAETLLTDAGLTRVGGNWHHNGTKITLKIGMLASLDNEAPDLMAQVSNQLGAMGFDRQVSQISQDDWNREVQTGKFTDYDLVIGKWSFGIVEDVNDLFHTREGKEGVLNIFNYSNAQVDEILERYDGARTDTQAKDAYHDLHAKLAEELPYLFLWKLDTKSGWRTEVRGNIITPYHYFTEIDDWTYSE